MPKYVELNKVADLFYQEYPENDGCTTILKSSKCSSEEIGAMLWKLPTVDAVPVVHGKWIHLSGCDVCSVCNYKTGKHDVGRNFCPDCGAKMDLEG